MRTLIVLFAGLLLTACGPDSELVASGKVHSCQLVALQARLQANPQDQAVQAEIRERSELLQTVIESAGEGNRAELQEAIQKAVAEGCP